MAVFRLVEQHLVFIIFLIYRFLNAPRLRVVPSNQSKSILLSAEKLAVSLFCWIERKKEKCPLRKKFRFHQIFDARRVFSSSCDIGMRGSDWLPSGTGGRDWLPEHVRQAPLPSCAAPHASCSLSLPQLNKVVLLHFDSSLLLCPLLAPLFIQQRHHGFFSRYSMHSFLISFQFNSASCHRGQKLTAFSFGRIKTGPEAQRRQDEANLRADGPTRTGFGSVQRPDHCRERRQEGPDGGQGCHRQ